MTRWGICQYPIRDVLKHNIRKDIYMEQVRLSIPFVGGITVIFTREEIEAMRKSMHLHVVNMKKKIRSMYQAEPKAVKGKPDVLGLISTPTPTS